MGVLDDKVAIVTGSARGIGRATAELLSEHGAKVVINDLDGDVAEQTASEIAGQSNYAAGKAAVVGLTKALAKEWGQFKINVNAVAFGWIETRLTASKVEDNTIEIGGERVQLGIPDQMRAMKSMVIPLGRSGTPEEAAGGVFFLCSPWSNFVHGQVLNVTGGQFTGMTT